MSAKLIPSGLLIAIEGIDGAGKTTLARGLSHAFEQVGAITSTSKEPTSGPYGTRLRESAKEGRLSPQEEVELLLLDRREHVENVILPALSRGEVVILDRYFPSMVAYQGAAGCDTAELLAANEFAPRPDVLLILDLDPEEGISRIRRRGDLPNAFEDLTTLSRCREIFLSLGIERTSVIDAAQTAENVLAQAQLKVLLALSEKALALHGRSAEAVDALAHWLPRLDA